MDVLASETVSLSVAAEFGARVIRLEDRRSGRNWLVDGPLDGAAADDGVYDGRAARGWDECFPTIHACTDPVWGRLRDHGILWGRAWRRTARGPSHVTHVLDGSGFRFARSLVLTGATIEARYELTNRGDTPMPWMWSQHCLLALHPGESFVLDGLGELTSPAGAFRPGPVRGADAGSAVKGYAPVHGRARVGITGPDGGIFFDWSAADAGHCGIWCDYGGWPVDDPVHQVAIEPATAPSDSLADAGASRLLLDPGAHRTWTIRIILTPREEAAT